MDLLKIKLKYDKLMDVPKGLWVTPKSKQALSEYYTNRFSVGKTYEVRGVKGGEEGLLLLLANNYGGFDYAYLSRFNQLGVLEHSVKEEEWL